MIKHVLHCSNPMRANALTLRRGGTQVIYTCDLCQHQELETYNSNGKPLRWVNLTLKRQIGEHVEILTP
jgi:hypothetical protein